MEIPPAKDRGSSRRTAFKRSDLVTNLHSSVLHSTNEILSAEFPSVVFINEHSTLRSECYELYVQTNRAFGSLLSVAIQLDDWTQEQQPEGLSALTSSSGNRSHLQRAWDSFEHWQHSGLNSSGNHLHRARELFAEHFMQLQQRREAGTTGRSAPVVEDVIAYAKVLLLLQDPRAALAEIEQSIWSLRHQQSSYSTNVGELYLVAGAACHLLQEYDSAVSHFERLHSQDPCPVLSSSQLQLLIARTKQLQYDFHSRNQSVGSDSDNENAIVEQHEHDSMYASLHTSYLQKHKQQQQDGRMGSEEIHEEVDDWLNDGATWLPLAHVLSYLQLPTLSIDLYTLVLARDAKCYAQPRLWMRLAKSCYRAGRVRDALLALQQARTRTSISTSGSTTDSAAKEILASTLRLLEETWLTMHPQLAQQSQVSNTSSSSLRSSSPPRLGNNIGSSQSPAATAKGAAPLLKATSKQRLQSALWTNSHLNATSAANATESEGTTSAAEDEPEDRDASLRQILVFLQRVLVSLQGYAQGPHICRCQALWRAALVRMRAQPAYVQRTKTLTAAAPSSSTVPAVASPSEVDLSEHAPVNALADHAEDEDEDEDEDELAFPLNSTRRHDLPSSVDSEHHLEIPTSPVFPAASPSPSTMLAPTAHHPHEQTHGLQLAVSVAEVVQQEEEEQEHSPLPLHSLGSAHQLQQNEQRDNSPAKPTHERSRQQQNQQQHSHQLQTEDMHTVFSTEDVVDTPQPQHRGPQLLQQPHQHPPHASDQLHYLAFYGDPADYPDVDYPERPDQAIPEGTDLPDLDSLTLDSSVYYQQQLFETGGDVEGEQAQQQHEVQEAAEVEATYHHHHHHHHHHHQYPTYAEGDEHHYYEQRQGQHYYHDNDGDWQHLRVGYRDDDTHPHTNHHEHAVHYDPQQRPNAHEGLGMDARDEDSLTQFSLLTPSVRDTPANPLHLQTFYLGAPPQSQLQPQDYALPQTHLKQPLASNFNNYYNGDVNDPGSQQPYNAYRSQYLQDEQRPLYLLHSLSNTPSVVERGGGAEGMYEEVLDSYRTEEDRSALGGASGSSRDEVAMGEGNIEAEEDGVVFRGAVTHRCHQHLLAASTQPSSSSAGKPGLQKHVLGGALGSGLSSGGMHRKVLFLVTVSQRGPLTRLSLLPTHSCAFASASNPASSDWNNNCCCLCSSADTMIEVLLPRERFHLPFHRPLHVHSSNRRQQASQLEETHQLQQRLERLVDILCQAQILRAPPRTPPRPLPLTPPRRSGQEEDEGEDEEVRVVSTVADIDRGSADRAGRGGSQGGGGGGGVRGGGPRRTSDAHSLDTDTNNTADTNTNTNTNTNTDTNSDNEAEDEEVAEAAVENEVEKAAEAEEVDAEVLVREWSAPWISLQEDDDVLQGVSYPLLLRQQPQLTSSAEEGGAEEVHEVVDEEEVRSTFWRVECFLVGGRALLGSTPSLYYLSGVQAGSAQGSVQGGAEGDADSMRDLESLNDSLVRHHAHHREVLAQEIARHQTLETHMRGLVHRHPDHREAAAAPSTSSSTAQTAEALEAETKEVSAAEVATKGVTDEEVREGVARGLAEDLYHDLLQHLLVPLVAQELVRDLLASSASSVVAVAHQAETVAQSVVRSAFARTCTQQHDAFLDRTARHLLVHSLLTEVVAEVVAEDEEAQRYIAQQLSQDLQRDQQERHLAQDERDLAQMNASYADYEGALEDHTAPSRLRIVEDEEDREEARLQQVARLKIIGRVFKEVCEEVVAQEAERRHVHALMLQRQAEEEAAEYEQLTAQKRQRIAAYVPHRILRHQHPRQPPLQPQTETSASSSHPVQWDRRDPATLAVHLLPVDRVHVFEQVYCGKGTRHRRQVLRQKQQLERQKQRLQTQLTRQSAGRQLETTEPTDDPERPETHKHALQIHADANAQLTSHHQQQQQRSTTRMASTCRGPKSTAPSSSISVGGGGGGEAVYEESSFAVPHFTSSTTTMSAHPHPQSLFSRSAPLPATSLTASSRVNIHHPFDVGATQRLYADAQRMRASPEVVQVLQRPQTYLYCADPQTTTSAENEAEGEEVFGGGAMQRGGGAQGGVTVLRELLHPKMARVAAKKDQGVDGEDEDGEEDDLMQILRSSSAPPAQPAVSPTAHQQPAKEPVTEDENLDPLQKELRTMHKAARYHDYVHSTAHTSSTHHPSAHPSQNTTTTSSSSSDNINARNNEYHNLLRQQQLQRQLQPHRATQNPQHPRQQQIPRLGTPLQRGGARGGGANQQTLLYGVDALCAQTLSLAKRLGFNARHYLSDPLYRPPSYANEHHGHSAHPRSAQRRRRRRESDADEAEDGDEDGDEDEEAEEETEEDKVLWSYTERWQRTLQAFLSFHDQLLHANIAAHNNNSAHEDSSSTALHANDTSPQRTEPQSTGTNAAHSNTGSTTNSAVYGGIGNSRQSAQLFSSAALLAAHGMEELALGTSVDPSRFHALATLPSLLPANAPPSSSSPSHHTHIDTHINNHMSHSRTHTPMHHSQSNSKHNSLSMPSPPPSAPSSFPFHGTTASSPESHGQGNNRVHGNHVHEAAAADDANHHNEKKNASHGAASNSVAKRVPRRQRGGVGAVVADEVYDGVQASKMPLQVGLKVVTSPSTLAPPPTLPRLTTLSKPSHAASSPHNSNSNSNLYLNASSNTPSNTSSRTPGSTSEGVRVRGGMQETAMLVQRASLANLHASNSTFNLSNSNSNSISNLNSHPNSSRQRSASTLPQTLPVPTQYPEAAALTVPLPAFRSDPSTSLTLYPHHLHSHHPHSHQNHGSLGPRRTTIRRARSADEDEEENKEENKEETKGVDEEVDEGECEEVFDAAHLFEAEDEEAPSGPSSYAAGLTPFVLLKKQLRILRKALHLPFRPAHAQQHALALLERPRMTHYLDAPSLTSSETQNRPVSAPDGNFKPQTRTASPQRPSNAQTSGRSGLKEVREEVAEEEDEAEDEEVRAAREVLQVSHSHSHISHGLWKDTGVAGHSLLGAIPTLSTEQLLCALADCRGSVGEVLGRFRDPVQGRQYVSDLRLACDLVDVRGIARLFAGADTLWEHSTSSSAAFSRGGRGRGRAGGKRPQSAVKQWLMHREQLRLEAEAYAQQQQAEERRIQRELRALEMEKQASQESLSQLEDMGIAPLLMQKLTEHHNNSFRKQISLLNMQSKSNSFSESSQASATNSNHPPRPHTTTANTSSSAHHTQIPIRTQNQGPLTNLQIVATSSTTSALMSPSHHHTSSFSSTGSAKQTRRQHSFIALTDGLQGSNHPSSNLTSPYTPSSATNLHSNTSNKSRSFFLSPTQATQNPQSYFLFPPDTQTNQIHSDSEYSHPGVQNPVEMLQMLRRSFVASANANGNAAGFSALIALANVNKLRASGLFASHDELEDEAEDEEEGGAGGIEDDRNDDVDRLVALDGASISTKGSSILLNASDVPRLSLAHPFHQQHQQHQQGPSNNNTQAHAAYKTSSRSNAPQSASSRTSSSIADVVHQQKIEAHLLQSRNALLQKITHKIDTPTQTPTHAQKSQNVQTLRMSGRSGSMLMTGNRVPSSRRLLAGVEEASDGLQRKREKEEVEEDDGRKGESEEVAPANPSQMLMRMKSMKSQRIHNTGGASVSGGSILLTSPEHKKGYQQALGPSSAALPASALHLLAHPAVQSAALPLSQQMQQKHHGASTTAMAQEASTDLSSAAETANAGANVSSRLRRQVSSVTGLMLLPPVSPPALAHASLAVLKRATIVTPSHAQTATTPSNNNSTSNNNNTAVNSSNTANMLQLLHGTHQSSRHLLATPSAATPLSRALSCAPSNKAKKKSIAFQLSPRAATAETPPSTATATGTSEVQTQSRAFTSEAESEGVDKEVVKEVVDGEEAADDEDNYAADDFEVDEDNHVHALQPSASRGAKSAALQRQSSQRRVHEGGVQGGATRALTTEEALELEALSNMLLPSASQSFELHTASNTTNASNTHANHSTPLFDSANAMTNASVTSTGKRLTRKSLAALVHYGALSSPTAVLCRRDMLRAQQDETLLRASDKLHVKQQVLKRQLSGLHVQNSASNLLANLSK